MKLKLEELKVQSFVTTDEGKQTLGGATYTCVSEPGCNFTRPSVQIACISGNTCVTCI